MRKITLQLLIFLGALFLNATQSKAFIYDIPQPGQREFIQDLAGLIDENHQQEIKQAADKILTQTGNPIIVVTINKMADHLDKGKTLRIETFAHFLFDQWEIGSVEIEGIDPETLNRGILLLISKGDRKARIQLGAGWGRQADGVCKQIMDRVIVPKFKQGNFSEGIKNGFESLAGMLTQGENIQVGGSYEGERYHQIGDREPNYLLYIGLAVLGIFTIISLVRSGQSGWAWVLWAGVFGIIFFILKAMASSSGGGGGGYSGGGYSGGSFGGGGYSGGGGATGSW